MTVLAIIQNHCRIHALNVPGAVVGSSDTTVQQLYGILNETLGEMVTESSFNVTTQEAVFTAIAAEDQGKISTLAPNGYQWIHNETLYDRTLKRPLYGPISDQEWQALKALPNPGPFYKYRIRGDHLLLNPTPVSPLSVIAFEYASSYPVVDAGGTAKATVTADTDTFVFPENIVQKGMMFRWKQVKGLPYQSDEAKYYELLNNYIARDKTRKRINLANPSPVDFRPGIFIPIGNWNQ